MTAPHDDSPVEQALTGGTLQAVGWYRFYFADERWEWSAEVAQIHGYQPGTVTPTTQEQCLKSVDRLGMGRTFPGDR